MITLIAITLSAIFKAMADLHEEGVLKPEKRESWRNKWKWGDPKMGEAFLGSSTIFVGFTDEWHRYNMFRNLCIMIAVVSFKPIVGMYFIDLFGLYILHNVIFEVYYSTTKKGAIS